MVEITSIEECLTACIYLFTESQPLLARLTGVLKFYNGLGRVGLKGLAVRLRMARPIQSQLLKVGPLQLFPTPRPGGRPRCIAAEATAHPPALQEELACALQCRLQCQHAHRPARYRVTRCSSRHQAASTAVGTLRTAVRPRPRK